MEMENLEKNYKAIDSYKTYVNMFIFMMLFYLGFYILIGIIGSISETFANFITTSKNAVYLQALVSPIMFCSLFFWQNRKKKFATITNIGLNKKVDIRAILFSIIMSILCLVFFSSFSTLFDSALELIGFNPSDSLNLVKDNVGYLFLNIFELALLPAVFEELIFRGIIFTGLNREHKGIHAILISSIMFSLMHGSLQQTLYQFIIGITLGIVMYATENIIYPIILHFTNNAVIVIIDFFTATSEETAYEFNAVSIIVPILLAVLGTVVLILLFKLIQKKKCAENSNTKVVKTFSSYSYNEKKFAFLGLIIAIVVWISNTVSMF